MVVRAYFRASNFHGIWWIVGIKVKLFQKSFAQNFFFTTYQLPFQNESSVAEWGKIDFRPFSKARKPRFDLSIKNFSISLIRNEKKPVRHCGWSSKSDEDEVPSICNIGESYVELNPPFCQSGFISTEWQVVWLSNHFLVFGSFKFMAILKNLLGKMMST